ncbi:hypothetical protein CNR22_19865 [Sphingobacteriaceae bacterium]|nr:hypothetical protein CNR22_19865 [Sphingobacteriaceae bacterium]
MKIENQNNSAQTVLITGGNAGLGYACATELLKSKKGAHWHVVIACRDQQRANEAVGKLKTLAGKDARVEAMALDLASFASIRNFAAEVKSKLNNGSLPPLHGIVCNAGVQSGTTKTYTKDGFETTFGVNHLGHFCENSVNYC